MDEKKRKCWSCFKYKAFYTKGYCHFDKKDIGFCQQHNKIVDKNNCCEQWCFGYASKAYRHHTIAEQLTEIKEKLNIIEIAMNEDINMNEL